MLEIAEAHRGLQPEEIRQLERYRRALGINKAELLRQTFTPVTDRMIEGSPREREEALRAMARVALADGVLSPIEHERLTEIAARLGVGRIELGNLIHEVEEERAGAAARAVEGGRGRRGLIVFVSITALAVVGLVARLAGSVVRANELQDLAERLDPALVLISVDYSLAKAGDVRRFTGLGTGFFVSPDGRLVTSKHVVEPWKFLADPMRLLDDGYRLDAGSVSYCAWPTGARVQGDHGEFVLEDSYCSQRGTLALLATCPDAWVRGARTCNDGRRHAGRYHALNNCDLAVLAATVRAPVVTIPFADDAVKIRSLDSIVVLGFPRGTKLLELGRAVSSPSAGTVSKTEDTIIVNAPIYPGNSGGPVVNMRGQVIGVAARRELNDDGLARCIRIRHARALLAGL